MAQAESTWVPGSATRWFTRPKMVTQPGTNRARRRVTMLIETDNWHMHDMPKIQAKKTYLWFCT